MKTIKSLLASAALAASLAGLAGSAQATAVAEQTFYFYGTCADCTPNASNGSPLATLVLAGTHDPESPLSITDLVSFSYVGSDKVYAYTVTPGNQLSNQEYQAYYMSGAMDSSPGGKDFLIEFDDGLRFQSTSFGSWYTCARGPDGYYSGTCDFLNNDDFGNSGGTWNTPGGRIPEPATLALFGVAALGLARRRPTTV